MAKTAKGDSLPDISKVSSGDGKKAKVEGGIVKAGSGKGDEFAEFSFKEGNTAVLKLQEIFVQEKGKDALKRLEATGSLTEAPSAPTAAPKVKGGAKGKAKAASKSTGKAAKTAKKTEGAAAKSVDKVLKYTPNKSSSRKETPQKAAVGKSSAAKRSTTGGKKQTPAMPSPGGGKQSTKTTDQMTMAQFKKFLAWHEQKKGGKASSGGKVLGKRSTGKASAASGKASKRSKK